MSTDPTIMKMVEYEDASDEVRAIYDDILSSRGLKEVPNAFKTFAAHPPTLRRIWNDLKEVMAPGALDPLTKEMIAVAVSITNNCNYCTRSHTASARKLGMTDAMHGELLAVTGLFNQTNALANGYKIPVDDAYMKSHSDEDR